MGGKELEKFLCHVWYLCKFNHIRHPHRRSLLLTWLLTCLALTVERLYRLRCIAVGMRCPPRSICSVFSSSAY